MTQKSRFSGGIGGLPDSEIEKLKKLRQTIGNRTRPSVGKTVSPQEGESGVDRPFSQKAKKIPRVEPNIPFLTLDTKGISAPSSCVALAKLAATAACNSSSCFILSWPAVTAQPSLAHVIATLSFYSIYKEQELRTLYWPAKTNTMNYLRRICINAQWLQKIAARVATARRDRERLANPEKTHFRDKTLAMLRLKDLTHGTATPLALSEYISAYHYKKDGTWIRRPGVLLESSIKAARQYKNKKVIRDYASRLARPEVAVDSLFCLHPELDLGELRLCLQSPVFDKNQGGAPPNLVFLDLRAANRFQTEKWFKKALYLFQQFQGKGNHAPTGVAVLVDSPLVYANLRRHYENWSVMSDIASERYQPKFAAMVDTEGLGLLQCRFRIAFPRISKASVDQQTSQRFRVQVTDRQTASLVKRFLDLAKEVHAFSSRANKALYDAARTLSDLSMLPGGMQALEVWLIGKLEEDGWKPGYGMVQGMIWKKKTIALDDLMHEGELGNYYGTAKNLLHEADEYIQGIQHSTPGGKALEAALEDSLRGEEQDAVSLMIVVDGQHHFYLAERMIADRFGAENRIQVILARKLAALEVGSETELICLFSKHASISYLFMLQQPPRSVQIIIGHSRAGKVLELLNVVLETAEYKKFHLLAKRLISQTKKGMVDIGMNSAPSESIDWDEGLTDTGIFDFSSSGYGYPRDKVIVRFAEHPPEFLAPRSTVFLLDRDSSWGYRSETAMNLEKGDTLLIIPKSITDQIVERLEAVYSVKSIEAKNHVRAYQTFVKKRLEIEKEENNGTCSPARISRKINEQANLEKPVRSSNVRYWIGFEDSGESDMTTLVPHAPKTWEHFKAFSIYLGLPESLARKVFVHILMLRRHNQKEGRRSRKEVLAILADEYYYHNSEIYPTVFIQEVRDQAERHSFRIQQVLKPEMPESDIRDIYGND